MISSQVRRIDGDGQVSHMIYPHEFVSMLYHDFPNSFVRHLGADVVDLERFWRQLLDTPYGVHLQSVVPSLAGRTPRDLRSCIPGIIHGDGVPYAKRSSAFFLQWGGLLGHSLLFQQGSSTTSLARNLFARSRRLCRCPGGRMQVAHVRT